ncbi:protein Lines homolog 1 isoform X2 [Mastacembelus armatus]|uniref:protein Lines homolog 1 isoform X2 n=1 Tax=Mastacembelus armatus TaxID=205130 RepID=UPI000E463CC4|nr:protein Lines homolog 1 isoform X2 [Mastacembelus armatus]
MQCTTSCRERPTTRGHFDCLTDAYRCFLKGSCPSESAADVAGMIYSGVCGVVHGEDRERVPAEYCHESSVELTCISVTLVEKMSCSLTSQSHPPEVRLYYEETLRMLFQDMDLMSQLVHRFQSEDQIISHLAAKSVSVCIWNHLTTSGTVSPVWQQTCVQAFYSSAPGTELDACLWSLTAVLKRLLKGAHQEILGKLLAAFDFSLSALCSKFLPEDRKQVTQSGMDFTNSRQWGTTFCLLLDLLEVLTASSLMCGAGVCLKSQRITHIHSAALLKTISCSSEYFVKKRALLLLKRTMLQKVGEDWALGEVLSTGLKYEHYSSDMTLLAQTVLTAVAGNWLQSVQVKSASFFGGTRHIRGDEGQKSDSVMLRAVSLLLLKAMELHIQTGAGTEGGGSATKVFGYLQLLWGFLRRCNVTLTEVTHSCCWVSLVFGEQDDDMMEAAKALLSIFLHCRLFSGCDDVAVLEAACVSGYNPHCHFLLLLKGVSFDHSILLDFLISSETCFLEYFVRYLKYLRVDWQGYTAACGRINISDNQTDISQQEALTCSRGGETPVLTYKLELDQVEFNSSVQPTCVTTPVEGASLTAGLRLVEYDSSDDSDPENMEFSNNVPGAVMREKNRFSDLHLKQETSGQQVSKRYESSNSKVSEPSSTLERTPERLSLPVLQMEQTSSTNTAPQSGQVTCEMSARVVHCLSELREVVMRLQTKNLFPYNPSSLIKLLAQVEKCSQQSHLSQCNK